MMNENIEILKEAGIDKILNDPELRALFHETATRILGQNCLNCEGKIRENYNLLINKNNNEMVESKYALNLNDVIIMNAPDWKEDLSNANMTDSKAESLLNRNLKYIFRFAKAPDLEELKIKAEEGVRTLAQARGKQRSNQELSYFDQLIALPKIGKATAEKIEKAFPNKESLKDGLLNSWERKKKY